jgi:leucyl aminopeptidase
MSDVATLSLSAPTRALRGDVLLVAIRPGRPGPDLFAGAEVADEVLGGQFTAALAAARASGRAEEVTKIPTLGRGAIALVVAVGLGEPATSAATELETIRRAVGAATRALAGTKTLAVSIGAPDDVETLAAVAEGVTLAAYAFTRYKSTSAAGSDSSGPVRTVRLRGAASPAARAALTRATAIGEATTLIRDLVNTPPADLYPASFATEITTVARAAGCSVQVLDERALARGGYGGIIGVGQGSNHPPRLVRVTWKPPRAKGRVALVGKGITFDTGGYSLKVPMAPSMKCDMAGAATMLATVIAAARLKLPVEVTATAALAENKVSSTAFLTSDVLRMRGGKTVEIDNTDAEGRLVLADAIVRASEDKPDFLVEASTLTGGALVALGQRTAGVMGSDDLRQRVVDTATAVGEPMWPMPLLADLRPGLDSPVADLRNTSGERYGQMLVGGLFLAEFVPAGLPWAHLDIAGPAWNGGGPHGYTPKGGTGYGVRTLLSLLEAAGATTR